MFLLSAWTVTALFLLIVVIVFVAKSVCIVPQQNAWIVERLGRYHATLELDKTFEEREYINHGVVAAIDEAAMNWGVKVLRYEIKDLTPPPQILHAMQAQITAEREKRALIASSEGRKQEQINIGGLIATAMAVVKSQGAAKSG